MSARRGLKFLCFWNGNGFLKCGYNQPVGKVNSLIKKLIQCLFIECIRWWFFLRAWAWYPCTEIIRSHCFHHLGGNSCSSAFVSDRNRPHYRAVTSHYLNCWCPILLTCNASQQLNKQGLYCVCAQRMRDVVTMYRRLQLAGCIHRITVPAFDRNAYYPK